MSEQKFEIGARVIFNGYGELEEGQQEILTEGNVLVVTGYSAETENYMVEDAEDANIVDNVFEEELTEAPAEEEAAPAPAEKPKRSRAAKPAAAKPAADKATEAAQAKAPAKTTAKGKGKGKTTKPATKPAAAETAPATEAAAAEAPKTTTRTATKPETTGGLVVMSAIADYVGDHETAIASASTLASAINERTEQLEQSKFQLGGVLLYIKQEEAYTEAGFESINAFCEERLGLKDRSCETYMQVYSALTAAGVTEKEIEGIGISKLRTVAGIIDKGNRRSLIAKAKKSSRDDLVEHVKEIRKGTTSATDPNATTYKKLPALKLPEDQATLVEAGLDEAMKRFSTESMAVALYHIVSEWMQGQEAEVGVDDALAAFNARYGTDFGFAEDDDTETEQQAA